VQRIVSALMAAGVDHTSARNASGVASARAAITTNGVYINDNKLLVWFRCLLIIWPADVGKNI
jgi:hypothetical protein